MFKIHIFRPSLLVFAFALVLFGCNGEDTEKPAEGTETETETEEATEADVEEKTEEETEENAQTGGELRIAYSAQPPSLDTHDVANFANSDIMRHVYETLVTIDSEYNVVPMLAESFEQSDDGTEITFELREGVLFHNGEEMTSEDVVASMERWSDGPGGQGRFDEATFEAEGDYNVVLRMPNPSSTALAFLSFTGTAFPAIMPKETVDGNEEISEFIGTGPFQYEDWVQDQHVHLSKFDDYQALDQPADGLSGKREALVDDIYFEFVLDSSTRVSGVQTGEYDISQNVPFDSVEQLEADENLIVYPYPQSTLNAYYNKRSGMFTDVEARRAVAASLDMESILQAAYTNEDFYALNHTIMMDHQRGQWDSDVGADVYNQNDPAQLQEYLDNTGYEGEEITIIATRDYEDHYNAAVVVQEQLNQHGLNVNLEVYDWATLLDLREDEEAYDIFMMGNAPAAEPTSVYYFDPLYAGWSDVPEDLVSEFRQLPTLEEGIDMYDDLQEWFWDYKPAIKIGDFSRVATMQNSVDNFQYQEGLILWNVSNNE